MSQNTRNQVGTGPEASGEKLLGWIWQHQHLRPGLATTEGEELRVVFPGRRNGLGGPDFRRAILAAPRGQLRGDVELHLRSSLWSAHGHQRDPAYNGVILHVVMWHDSPAPVCLHNGHRVPTLALAPYVLRPEAAMPYPEPCPGRGSAAEVAALLDAQGEARFKAKAARFGDRLQREAAGQVLYEGIMEALGYSRNQEAFRELARRLPLAQAETITRRYAAGTVKARLLDWAEGIPWQRHGVRPGNQPLRRLGALSHLLVRYADHGWLSGLMAAVSQAAGEASPRALEAALTVPGLGRGRVGEIAVNILLPFAFAYGRGPEAASLYRVYPAPGENGITREMSELLGLGRELVNTARRQQGLIHLFKSFCAERQCGLCPLGTPLPLTSGWGRQYHS